MTDVSEPAAAPAPAVLARGHLHPAILLLRFVEALQQAVLPLAAGVVLMNPWLLGFGGLMFLLRLGYALARYLTLQFTLTADELRVREGLLERQERRIPLDRIQDLGFESSLLRRALGLVTVSIETASGLGVEARLDALSRADADHLREVLLAARAAATLQPSVPPPTAPADGDAGAAAPAAPTVLPVPPAAEPEWLVHRASTGELLLRGVTDMRLSAFFVTGFAAWELADQLDVLHRFAGTAKSLRDWLLQFSPLALALFLVGLLFVVMLFGVVTSTLGNLVTFHGFELRLRGDVLQRRYGLLTTRQKTLPRARIQRVTVEQTWLRRLLGLGAVKADSAGGSRTDGADVTGGWDVVVPLTAMPRAQALLPALLPGLERETFAWSKGSPRLVVRTGAQGLLLAALLLPPAWLRYGPFALLALLLVPAFAVLGVLVWRNLAYALGQDMLTLQHGIIGRTLAFVPTTKVQAVVVRQGPVAQLLGLADLTVYVAGGSPTRLPDLTIADARGLAHAIAARAGIAAAASW
ncbi:MAG: PH domain-containing protein [Planctomycetes bacterium]|nr:PH domain-containing protein [Planctomycetota bacterium]